MAPGTQSPSVELSFRLRGSAPPSPQEARRTSARNHRNTPHLRTSPPLPVYLLGTTFEIFNFSWFRVTVNSIHFTLKTNIQTLFSQTSRISSCQNQGTKTHWSDTTQKLVRAEEFTSKTPQMTSVGKDVEKREPSYTIGENVNWYSHHGGQYEGSLKN